jgi:hypothetical protein
VLQRACIVGVTVAQRLVVVRLSLIAMILRTIDDTAGSYPGRLPRRACRPRRPDLAHVRVIAGLRGFDLQFRGFCVGNLRTNAIGRRGS